MKKPIPMKPGKMKMRFGKPVAKAAAGGFMNPFDMSNGARMRNPGDLRDAGGPPPAWARKSTPPSPKFPMLRNKKKAATEPTTGGESPAYRKGGKVSKGKK